MTVLDTFARTSTGNWGAATSGQGYTVAQAPTFHSASFSVSAGVATHAVDTHGGYCISYLPGYTVADVDATLVGSVAFTGGITGGQVEACGLTYRGLSTAAYYLARLEVQTDLSVTLSVYGHDVSNSTLIGQLDNVLTGYTSGTSLHIRVVARGPWHGFYVWTGATQPSVPQLILYDAEFTAAGWVGVRSGVSASNTNTLNVVFSYTSLVAGPFNDAAVNGTAVIEAAFGADLAADPSTWTWTDISADVMYQAGLSITQGRSDSSSQAQAAICSFTLLNQTGAYSPYQPSSVHYPYVRRNTPIRVRFTGAILPAFFGYANGWTPDWSASASAKLAVVQVSASGSLRRLTQGNAPVRSAMFRAASSAVAHWSFEDAEGSSRAASAVPGQPDGVALATWPLNTAIPPTFGATGPVGAVAAIDLTGGGQLLMSPITGVSSTGWTVEFSMQAAVGTGGQVHFLWVETNSTTSSDVGGVLFETVNSGSLYYMAAFVIAVDGSVLADVSPTTRNAYDGAWHTYRLQAGRSGGNVDVQLSIDGTPVGNDTAAGAALGALNLANVNQFNESLGQGFMVGLAVYNTAYSGSLVWAGTPDSSPAIDGYTGETASDRPTRLCVEESINLTLVGTSNVEMGPQPVAAFIDLLRDCETVDGGLLFDGFDPGLGYICLSSRYNLAAAIVVDAASSELAPPFAPVDDDQRNRNDFTVSRSGGSSARFIDQDGPLGVDAIGTYDSSLTVNTSDDSPLEGIAAWNVHLGTVEGLRYPTLFLDLFAAPTLAADWVNAGYPGLMRADVNNIADLVAQHPPDDVQLLVEGWTITYNPNSWLVATNCSPFTPWRVAVVDDASTGRVSADDAALAGTLTTTFTGSRTVTVGHLWTTTAGDFPMDINVGGERITLSNITGSSSPQTFVISARSVNGVVKAHSAGEPVDVWTAAVVAL